MCCFSGPISRVSDTRIFARLDGDRQLLAYQMKLGAAQPVAMVLPVPVPPRSAEDAVRFIDLSAEPYVFDRLRGQFEETGEHDLRGFAGPAAAEGAALEVHQVGSFEASFVPSAGDFARLDARFRLSDEVLRALPGAADWGFVVFKLRPDAAGGETDFHPMAFSFPTRTPGHAWFPCVHVHDGQVHADAEFDHQLFVQLGPGCGSSAAGWRRSTSVLGDGGDSQVIDPAQLGFYLRLEGKHPNRDVWLPAEPETSSDAKLRAESWQHLLAAQKERELWEVRERRRELTGRIVRGVIGLPIAALLGFLVVISDDTRSTVVFTLAMLPAMWVVLQAVLNSARGATICTLLAAGAAVLARLL